MSRQNRKESLQLDRILEASWPNGDPRLNRNDRVGLFVSVAAVALVVIWLGFAAWGWLQ